MKSHPIFCGYLPIQRKYFHGIMGVILLFLCLVIWSRWDRRSEVVAKAWYHDGMFKKKISSKQSSTSGGDESVQRQTADINCLDLKILQNKLLAAQKTTCPIAQNAYFERCMVDITPRIAADLIASFAIDELNGIAARRLFNCWISHNPQAALEWAMLLDDSPGRATLLNLAAVRWAASNLENATIWLERLPAGDFRDVMTASVVEGALQIDPIDALRLASKLPEGFNNKELIIRASGEWAYLDRDSAIEWAQEIRDIGIRQEVIERIAIVAADQDVRAAAHIAIEYMAPGSQQDRALVAIVQRWVQVDPLAAASWVSQFPDDSLGQHAASILIETWATTGLEAAGKWLSTLSPGMLRTQGVQVYSQFCVAVGDSSR